MFNGGTEQCCFWIAFAFVSAACRSPLELYRNWRYTDDAEASEQIHCRDPPLPPPSATVLGELIRCMSCGPSEINARQMGQAELMQRFAPISASEYYQRTAFVLDPLYETAEAAGAILLDPTSSMCHGDLCPTVDAQGFPTSQTTSISIKATCRFGSFLDVTAGMEEQDPPTSDEYCV
eukprot:COSAG06_NODE_1466_length_9367_cov_6.526651_2_plen_178_part_00